LRDKPSLQELLEVQNHFNLPSPVLVEKDWYVVRALAAINTADVKPFRLVFSGGTALSRAHRLTRRMSEDIDLKNLVRSLSVGLLGVVLGVYRKTCCRCCTPNFR
jgi:hypothetical protein